MAKPAWLKTTQIKARISDLFVRWFAVRRHQTDRSRSERVLVLSLDGLGDAFLRLSMVHALVEKHGPNNVVLLTRGVSIPLYEGFGIEVIAYSDRQRTNPVKRVRLVQRLNALNVSTVYAMDFTLNENLIEFLDVPTKIGFSHSQRPEWNSRLTILVPHQVYVGDAMQKFCDTVSIDPSLMDNTAFFPRAAARKVRQSGALRIGVAIGASNVGKMMRLTNFSKILLSIAAASESVEFVLYGAGDREKRYAQRLLETGAGLVKMHNKVSVLGLDELIADMQEIDALIGFDSAVYNLAFTLKKPVLCLAGANESVLHKKPWVFIVRGTGDEWGDDDGFGSVQTNSIQASAAVAAFMDLLSFIQAGWVTQSAEGLHCDVLVDK